MIRLVVEDYCQNCPDFEPEVNSNEFEIYGEKHAEHVVTCIRRQRCKKIYERALSHFKQTSE